MIMVSKHFRYGYVYWGNSDRIHASEEIERYLSRQSRN